MATTSTSSTTTTVNNAKNVVIPSAYDKYMTILNDMNGKCTDNQIMSIISKKNIVDAYVILYALKKTYGRDLLKPSWASALTMTNADVEWHIVPDSKVAPTGDDDIKQMLNNTISVSGFITFCQYLRYLTSIISCDYVFTVDETMQDMPIDLNIFAYTVPVSTKNLNLGLAASQFIDESILRAISSRCPNIQALVLRCNTMKKTTMFPNLYELHQIALAPSQNGYDFTNYFPTGLQILELATLGFFDPAYLLYGGDASGQSALMDLQSLTVKTSASDADAENLQQKALATAASMGIAPVIRIDSAGNGARAPGKIPNPAYKQ